MRDEGRSPPVSVGISRGLQGKKKNSLMFMTQNASVEEVAARTHKTERNDFMLITRAGVR